MTFLAILMLVPVFAGAIFWYTSWAERRMLEEPPPGQREANAAR